MLRVLEVDFELIISQIVVSITFQSKFVKNGIACVKMTQIVHPFIAAPTASALGDTPSPLSAALHSFLSP